MSQISFSDGAGLGGLVSPDGAADVEGLDDQLSLSNSMEQVASDELLGGAETRRPVNCALGDFGDNELSSFSRTKLALVGRQSPRKRDRQALHEEKEESAPSTRSSKRQKVEHSASRRRNCEEPLASPVLTPAPSPSPVFAQTAQDYGNQSLNASGSFLFGRSPSKSQPVCAGLLLRPISLNFPFHSNLTEDLSSHLTVLFL